MATDLFSLSIKREALYKSTGVVYRLVATATVTKDASPTAIRLDQNIFVKSVADSSFLRVANASDLGSLESDLDNATSLGHSEYRDSVASFEFSDVDTAVAAIPVLRDRVNTSVHNYVKYMESFSTENVHPISYNLPLPVTSAEERDAYIAAYTNARDSREEAEAIVAQNQASVDAVDYKTDFASDLKKLICDLYDSVSAKSTEVAQMYSLITTGAASVSSALTSLNTNSTANYDEEGDLISYSISPAVHSQLKNALTEMRDSVVPSVSTASTSISFASGLLESKCNELTALHTSLTSQTSSLSAALTAAASELAAAAATESLATAELSEYCPEVDPNTL